ncbi:hypothetical protein GEMMAAP_00270 [Gemmatimonas phototrophica]|uniref:TonB-dependent receptor-like beta-barrel domain-containing protein n=2 Tax=Gemmatimonas phototrophica TaxID=1379270 RepID=A0A143BGH1_9BACT|nr:hypothetical protein GEMMAAP_00270 [Gemmatimonas phototrophica]
MMVRAVAGVAVALWLSAPVLGAQTAAPLRQLLQDASLRNRLPDSLISYKANVETEIAILLRREEGVEAVGAIEQVASRLRWNRAGGYEQRVQGYRAQQLGGNVSMLTLFQTGWINPVLYGNRLRVRPRSSNSRGQAAAVSRNRDGSDTLPAVHPLATDRDAYYTYSGGDTIVTMRAGDRVIPIAHVRVQPRPDVKGKVILFDGEMDLDASRGTLVRLRGHFLRTGASRSSLGSTLADAVAYVEYENGERNGQYWLPATQRIELQANSPLLGDGRAVIRIVSRFANMEVNDTVLDAATLAKADSLRALARRPLTYASTDSLNRFSAWRYTIGASTNGMHADDFQDIAPDRWRTTGPPRFDLSAPRPADVMHFNRVEGLFTGVGGKFALRDLAPGVVVRANAGYAWAEQTVRGRVAIERTRGPWSLELRGGRSMDITNDFRAPLDSGNTFAALSSLDSYDYVSRNFTALSAVRRIGARRWILRADVGYGDDRYRAAQYVRGPFGGDLYRANHGVDEGSYMRSAAVVEWHPDLNAESLKPGLGARVAYERGDGTLSWQRTEARLSGRRPVGPFMLLARGDVGMVTGSRIPSQQLFELGKYQNLPSYEDKQFAGSRAAALRASLQYTSKFLRNPIRVGQFWLPAVAPGLSVGAQSGWADAPTNAARASVDRLTVIDPTLLALWAPVATPTGRVRASVTAGFRFFGNALFVGATRPVDQSAKWRTLVGLGQQW